MNGSEVLTTIAQLGMAVTGFSGIAIAFKRTPGKLSEFEAFRVVILFANSLAAVFLSLIPFAFYHAGWNDRSIWRASSGLLFLFELFFLASQIPAVRRFLRLHREFFNIKLLTFVVCGHFLNMILQLLNTIGLTKASLSFFIFGLLWILFQSVFQFGRILFVQRDS